MARAQVRDTTTVFVMLGEEIQKTIQNRIARHNGEIGTCLTKVADVLKEKSQYNIERLPDEAAALMLVLASGQNLTATALVVQTNVERASFLSKEVLDLTCIGKNLDSEGFYNVTLEEAKRYGLV